jgi:hypothetical protein
MPWNEKNRENEFPLVFVFWQSSTITYSASGWRWQASLLEGQP